MQTLWSKSPPGLKPPPLNQEQKGPVAIPQGGSPPAVLISGLSWTPTYNDSLGVAGSSPESPVVVPQLTAIPQVPTTAQGHQGAALVRDDELGKARAPAWHCKAVRTDRDSPWQVVILERATRDLVGFTEPTASPDLTPQKGVLLFSQLHVWQFGGFVSFNPSFPNQGKSYL